MTAFLPGLTSARQQITTSRINETHLLLAGGFNGAYSRSVDLVSRDQGLVGFTQMPEAERSFCLVKVSGDRVLKIGGYV